MPDNFQPSRKPDTAAARPAGAAKVPSRSAFFAYFGLSLLTAIVVIGGSCYLYGFDPNRAFFNMGAILSLCLIVPLVFGIARRRRVWRVIAEVLGALLAAVVVSFFYVYVCVLVVGVTYTSATTAAPTFANQYFALVDNGHTGFVTANQLAAISREQFALRGALMDVDSAEQSLKATSGIPTAQRDVIIEHYEAIRQEIASVQLPQSEVESIDSLNRICFAGHPINSGADCAVSLDDLLHFKSKVEQAYPQWISLLRRVHLIQ